MRLHLFNPEHDFALASGEKSYTPPAAVANLRKRLALLPAIWAEEGDAILLPPELPASEIRAAHIPQLIQIKKLELVAHTGLRDFIARHPGLEYAPWGWDFQVRNMLLRAGAAPDALPSPEAIRKICELSHRRLAVTFNEAMGVEAAVEIKTALAALNWLEHNPGGVLKAPWSSSGRGVLTTADLTQPQVQKWVKGFLSRQGSVMAETFFPHTVDFASEWNLHDGHADYLGMAVTFTTETGRYRGNLLDSQEEIKEYIDTHAPNMGMGVIDEQRRLLEMYVAPYYNGPVGIDMMSNDDGRLRPCVEINLRMTMGRVAIETVKRGTEPGIGSFIASYCPELFSSHYDFRREARMKEKERPRMKVCIIGKGNVGTHLAKAIGKTEDVHVADSRTLEGYVPDAHIYIIAVKDDAIAEVAARLPLTKGLVVHTSGTAGIEAVARSHRRAGVLYPLQSFSKDVKLDYSQIPFFIEATDKASEGLIRTLAEKVSRRVEHADAARRQKLHLAAVFANNFGNNLLRIADSILHEGDMDITVLNPLLKEMLRKAMLVGAANAQTGPASRGDVRVMDEHYRQLVNSGREEEAEIYRIMSASIMHAVNSTENHTPKEKQ